MLGFTVAGINIQPSELVKIVFVFFVASSFKRSKEFKDLVVTTVVAAFHVLILVVSKDLGAALIIFVVYLVMLYVATHQPLYILAGLGAGSLGAVAAYHLFTHVKTRVNGEIHSELMIMAAIRWHSHYLPLEPVDGLVRDSIRDSRIRFRYLQKTLSFLQFRKRWD